MTKKIVHTKGEKFGKLTIIKQSVGNYKGCYWHCLCECGKNLVVYGGHLRSGARVSCGCNSKIKDISGNIYGYINVIGFAYTKTSHSYWNCQCICGQRLIIPKNNLKRGNTKSCGCKAVELEKNTCLKRYGSISSFQNKDIQNKFKKTCLDKYGVEYPAQNKDIALKVAKSQKNSCTLKHWKTKKDLVCVASYEKAVVEYFNKNKIDFKWQHKVFDIILENGKKTTYRPDLYLIGSRKPWVEIKGYFRNDAKEKWNIFHNHIKPNSELWDKEKLIKMGIL